MIRELMPAETFKSVFTIDYQRLYQQGYRGLLFDIDNTLVHHQADSTPEVDTLFRKLKNAGFQTLILSNNSEERVLCFLKHIDSLYISNAGKPSLTSYIKACKMLNLDIEQVVMIGDQLFTDVRGANRAGMHSILVNFLRTPGEKWFGWHRYAEYGLLLLNKFGKVFHMSDKCQVRLIGKWLRGEILFCEISPTAYSISLGKEIIKRKLRDLYKRERFAKRKEMELLPFIADQQETNMIRRAPGIDLTLQKNKVLNIRLASSTFDRMIIRPGETFSFWKNVGRPTRKKGYRDGRIIKDGKLMAGPAGGLCNLANILHLLVLNSPMTVTEYHTHSDALAPEEGPRKPFSSGTSVSYNNIDFRFLNTTDQTFQIVFRFQGEVIHAQLRCEHDFPFMYKLSEEDHHFRKEGNKYFRISKIYRETYAKATGELIGHVLVHDNHSEVMYDPKLIPAELIRDEPNGPANDDIASSDISPAGFRYREEQDD